MIAIRIELLNGSYHAADHTLRSPEWPPHPDRIFQALVATLHRMGNDQRLRELLLLIESVPWRIHASNAVDRPMMKQYVPRNEDQGGGGGSYNPVFATERMKERYLPITEPIDPVVHYIIDVDLDIESLRPAVEQVARLGRSLIAASIVDQFPAPNWVPASSGSELLVRVPYVGRITDLESAFAQKKRAGVRWANYQLCGSSKVAQTSSGIYSELIVLAASGRGVDGSRIAPLLESARRSILSICDDPLPEWLTGHSKDGSPLQDTHLGVAPTIFSGRHGDGRIMGIGLLVPKRIDGTESRNRLQPVLQSGLILADQIWNIENSRTVTTEASTWTRSSRLWASATPLEIRRRDRRSAIEIASEWAERSGLPPPMFARLRAEPFLVGPMHARNYAQGKRPRLRMHAMVEWDAPITGPIALGMGRYRGFGFMRPISGVGSTQNETVGGGS